MIKIDADDIHLNLYESANQSKNFFVCIFLSSSSFYPVSFFFCKHFSFHMEMRFYLNKHLHLKIHSTKLLDFLLRLCTYVHMVNLAYVALFWDSFGWFYLENWKYFLFHLIELFSCCRRQIFFNFLQIPIG